MFDRSFEPDSRILDLFCFVLNFYPQINPAFWYLDGSIFTVNTDNRESEQLNFRKTRISCKICIHQLRQIFLPILPNLVPFQISVRLFEDCPSTDTACPSCSLHTTQFGLHSRLFSLPLKMRPENNVTNLNEIFTIYF